MGWNHLQESDPYLLTFEMVNQVRGITLKDYEEVTTKDEVKWFYLYFESFGAHTCVFMDFDDGVQKTFGDPWYCNYWMPDVPYEPGVEMTEPVEITHTFG